MAAPNQDGYTRSEGGVLHSKPLLDFLDCPGADLERRRPEPEWSGSFWSWLSGPFAWGAPGIETTVKCKAGSKAICEAALPAPRSAVPLPWVCSEDVPPRLEDAIQTLDKEGCLLIESAVSAHACQRLAEFVDCALASAHQEVNQASDARIRSGLMKRYFRKLVHEGKQDRIELTLPLVSEVREVLEPLCALVAPILEPFLSREAPLVDLSCMITDADAEQQPLHADTKILDSAILPLFTVFVSLQDISRAMGPTWLCPRSHTAESHLRLMALRAALQSSKPRDMGEILLQQFGASSAECSTGTAIIMNSQLLHCGGAQAAAERGGRRRRLLYVTFHRPGNTPAEHSLRDELVGEYRLSDFDGRAPLAQDKDEVYQRLFVEANKRGLQAMLDFGLFLRTRGDRGAVKWLKRAKDKGHPLASMHLAEIYLKGELGIFQDPIQGEHFRQEGLRLYQALKQRASSSPDDAPAEPEKGRAPSVERCSGSWNSACSACCQLPAQNL
ncbi:unnamed protein product [Symbiodinium necroappetens]|uniref:Uncharacterized protein n=1 Tax=Symbiodinium necroappetens TaxID=1628268 RepID=A0A812PIJ0_9DINO|nr:unnamed protein product [Symbiodinium necroappetens]